MVTHKVFMYAAKDATVTTKDEIKVTIEGDKKRIEFVCKELVYIFSLRGDTLIDYTNKNDNRIILVVDGNIEDLTIN